MTKYTQGTNVEYGLIHFYQYWVGIWSVVRPGESRGLSDMTVTMPDGILMIQAKKHERLREPKKEQWLIELPKPPNVHVYTAWPVYIGRKKYFRVHDLVSGNEADLTPLTKAQEKELQRRKKSAYLWLKQPKKSGSFVNQNY